MIFSFGEADNEVLDQFENQEIFKDRRVQVFRSSDLGELKKELTEQAAVFLGNDSGPGHLAASLGIPARIVFRSKDKESSLLLGRDRIVW